MSNLVRRDVGTGEHGLSILSTPRIVHIRDLCLASPNHMVAEDRARKEIGAVQLNEPFQQPIAAGFAQVIEEPEFLVVGDSEPTEDAPDHGDLRVDAA